MPTLRPNSRPCLDQHWQAFHWINSTQKKCLFSVRSTPPPIFYTFGSTIYLWQVHPNRNNPHRYTEPEALNVTGFRLRGSMMATRPFQVPPLIQPPSNALFRPLVVYRPGFEHAMRAHHAWNIMP